MEIKTVSEKEVQKNLLQLTRFFVIGHFSARLAKFVEL